MGDEGKVGGTAPGDREAPGGGAPRADGWRVRVAAALIVAAGIAVYFNSFGGKFLFDDEREIVNSPHVRRFWPPWAAVKGARPVVDWTLALNFRLGGLDVWGYHALNLAVHVLAALTLFGIVRRTLLRDPLRQRFAAASLPLALAVAVLWLVHPLQTAATTYVIQRAESLMGLFYLLTLYCVIRGLSSPRPAWWHVAATAACAMGMGTKQVMVTAPVMVLLYDRLVGRVGFREIFRKRGGLYAALAGTWLILAALHWYAPPARSAGFAAGPTRPLEYAATQFGVIVRYLKLSAWPASLCLDYWWPAAGTAGEVLPAAMVTLALLAATGIAIWRRPPLGFLGVWFFLILAPTSSIMPIADPIYEHRMYLPLAAMVALIVLGGHAVVARLPGRVGASARLRALLGAALVVAAAVPLGCLTVRRNHDYRSAERMWRDVMNKRKRNPRATLNLALELRKQGKIEQAIPYYRKTIELRPNHPKAYSYLGAALRERGEEQEGMGLLLKAVELAPSDPVANNNLGVALVDAGRLEEGIRCYRTAIEAEPRFVEARCNLGTALAGQKMYAQAVGQLEEAVRLRPDWPELRYNLGVVLDLAGRTDEAICRFRDVIRASPSHADAHSKLGVALIRQGGLGEAADHLAQAARIDPDLAEARYYLGVALAAGGRGAEAVEQFRSSLRLGYRRRGSLNNLAWLLATCPDEGVRNGAEAVQLARRACGQGGEKDPSLLDTLAAALAEAGRFDEAVRTARRAIDLAEQAGQPELVKKLRRRMALYRAKRPFRDAAAP